ncbi:hypothetical protein FRC11_013207, partial [Ceratobasidium sp. 423]
MINSYQELNPGARLDNFETPKAFILMIVKAINDRYGDPNACLRAVHHYWKNTTAGMDQGEELVNPKLDGKLTGLQFIKGALQEELGLSFQKHARKFGTMSHFLILRVCLWGCHWHKYGSLKDCLDLWDGIMLNIFTSAHVGKYIESNTCEGGGQGLCYKDVESVIFHNKEDNPKFAMEIMKDGIGMTATPWRNHEHSLHKEKQ